MSDVALRFGARDDGLNAQFIKTGKDLDALQGRVTRASTAISASFGTIATAAAAIGFGKLIGDALEFADQLEAATARTGISVEGLQKLQLVAKTTSGDLGTITAAISRMQVQLSSVGEGSADAEKALARLHIPIGDFFALKPDEQFEKVAVAIANIDDPAKRTAAAVGIFGKSGAELLPVLISTGAELEKVSAQLVDMGGAVSKDAIDKVDDLGDSFATLKIAATNLTTELVSGVAPALTNVVGLATKFIAGLRIAAGGGDNEVIKITGQIEKLQARIEGIQQSTGLNRGFGLDVSTERDRKAVADLNKQIDELQKKLNVIQNFGVEGAAAEKSRIAAIDAQLTPFTITQKLKAPAFIDTPEGKRQVSLASDNPFFIEAEKEKDLALKINQEKLDALLVQETKAATDRINLSGNTNATILDKVDAFSGQVINFARLRADFEQNSSLATLGIVGQALSLTFQKNKGVQIALATISTISGVARALSDYPYPYSLVIGAAVAATGLAQIAQIKATNFNSSGSVSGSVGGVSGGGVGSAAVTTSPVSAPPAPSQQRGVAQITINGDIMGEQSMRWLVDRLRETIGDFDLVLNRTN